MGKVQMFSSKTFRLKRIMFMTLLIPYLCVGVLGVILLSKVYSNNITNVQKEIKITDESVLKSVQNHINNLSDEMKRISILINSNIDILRLQDIEMDTQAGYLAKYRAVSSLDKIQFFNPLMKEVVVYISQSNMYLKAKSIRTLETLYEEYEINTSRETLEHVLTKQYIGNQFINLEGKHFIITSVWLENGSEYMNLIYRLNDIMINDILSNYQNIMTGNFMICNSDDIFYYDTSISYDTAQQLSQKSKDSNNTTMERMRTLEDSNLYYTIYHDEKQKQNYVWYITKQQYNMPDWTTLRGYFVLLISYFIVLLLGIILINNNYRKIKQIILRLYKVSGEKEHSFVGEINYMNKALNHIEIIQKDVEKIRIESGIKKALYGSLDVEDEGYFFLMEKYPQWKDSYFITAVIFCIAQTSEVNKEQDLMSFILQNVLQEIMDRLCYIKVVANNDHYMIIINDSDDLNKKYDLIVECLKEAQKYFFSVFKYDFKLGVSSVSKGVLALGILYKEAYQALMNCIQYEAITIQLYNQIKNEAHPQYSIVESEKVVFKNLLESGKIESINEYLNRIYEQYFKIKNDNGISNKLMAIDMINEINNLANQKNTITNLSVDRLFDYHFKYKDLFIKFKESIEQICEQKEKTISDTCLIVHKIQEYVEREYRDQNLSVTSIAYKFSINPSYLSRVFKEHANINLLVFIASVRIEHAKKALVDSETTITQIALNCGFSNVNVMIRTFKKMEGLTPGEYRLMKSKI